MPRNVKNRIGAGVAGERFTYVPEACRADPPDEQVRITVLNPNDGDRRCAMANNDNRRGDADRELVEKFVVKVENYHRDGVPITNGAELWAMGELKISIEAAHIIMLGMALTDEQKKTSGGSSTSATTPPAPSPAAATSETPTAPPSV